MNKVLTNLSQSLSSNEKQIARSNIGAVTVSVSNPVTGYSGDLAFTYNGDRTCYEVNVNNNPVANLMPSPSTSGQVLRTDNDGHIGWGALPADASAEYWEADSLPNIGTATNIASVSGVPGSETVYEIKAMSEDYNQIWGTVTFTPDTDGIWAAVPRIDIGQGEFYDSTLGVQTSSVKVGVANVPVTIPFYYHSNQTDITNAMVYVAIKGQSSIGQLHYQPVILTQKRKV